ncbi:MAG: hypothetical protein WBQ79_08880 [Acidobacteriaceae bacterium]
MQLRDAKRIWRHRQAAIANQIRDLEQSPERSARDGGIIQKILSSYRREWDRYNQLIHANDRSGMRCMG